VLASSGAQLAIDLVDVEIALGRQRRDVGAEAGGDGRIGVEAAALVAMLGAERDAERSARQVEQAAGDVGADVPQTRWLLLSRWVKAM
jgi:hypothetical protein